MLRGTRVGRQLPTLTERPNRPFADLRFTLTAPRIPGAVHLFDHLLPVVNYSYSCNQSIWSSWPTTTRLVVLLVVGALGGGPIYLTQCFHYWVFESQLPYKTVNVVFELVIVNNKLTILCGN